MMNAMIVLSGMIVKRRAKIKDLDKGKGYIYSFPFPLEGEK